MNKTKVIKVDSDSLEFENEVVLTSDHDSDCCESHYLSFSDLTIDDFDGLEFDLTLESFFERIDGYGIALKPLTGHPVRIPGYGSNNGYYSSSLDLVLTCKGETLKVFDVTDCQVISD
jgi:hypothetical protein